MNQIASVAEQFGPHSSTFPVVSNPNMQDPAAELGRLHGNAAMCTTVDLRSAPRAFHEPSPDVRTSPC